MPAEHRCVHVAATLSHPAIRPDEVSYASQDVRQRLVQSAQPPCGTSPMLPPQAQFGTQVVDPVPGSVLPAVPAGQAEHAAPPPADISPRGQATQLKVNPSLFITISWPAGHVRVVQVAPVYSAEQVQVKAASPSTQLAFVSSEVHGSGLHSSPSAMLHVVPPKLVEEQSHEKLPVPSEQTPPFRQGAGAHSLMLVEQVVPEKPVAHEHVKPVKVGALAPTGVSVQTPPFWHGKAEHGVAAGVGVGVGVGPGTTAGPGGGAGPTGTPDDAVQSAPVQPV